MISWILFYYAATSNAQQKEYIYEDSSLNKVEVPAGENTGKVKEDNISENEKDSKPDTVLYFNKLAVSSDTINSWKNSKTFAYTKYLDSLLKARRNIEVKEKRTYTGPNFFDKLFASKLTKVIFWGLAIIFVLFIIYRLFLVDGVFKNNITKSDQFSPVVKEETFTAETDFEALIRLAVADGNYRLAIRYQYLKTLHLLAHRGWVQLTTDKTNYQYVREIKNYNHQNSFSKLTLNYEYAWYGEFEIEQHIYLRLQNEFSDFNKKV
jgi:hypothetical protein